MIQIDLYVTKWSLGNWRSLSQKRTSGHKRSSSSLNRGQFTEGNKLAKSQKTLMKTVDEANEANIKQDEKIEFLSEKIASNDSQVFYLASELKATQDDLASRNRQIKRLKFVQTEVDDDDKGYKSDDAGKRMKRDHMKKTQDFIRTTTKGSEQKQRQLIEALAGQLGAKDEPILHTMINGISSVLKQYSTGGRPSNEGMTVKRVLLTAICSEWDPSQCSLASKLLGVKSETLTDHSNLSHKIATGEESMIV